MINPYESPRTIAQPDASGLPTKPIVIDGSMTVADVLAARRLMTRHYWLRVLAAVSLGATASVMIFLFFNSSFRFQTRATTAAFAVVALTFPALVLVRLGFQRLRLVRMASSRTGIFLPTRASFSVEKIETSSGVSRTEYYWEAFCSYRAGKSVIVLFSKTANLHLVIARSKTLSAADWEGLLVLVQSKMPPF